MNLSKKAFALFLLVSLTAGQAQAVTVEITTDKVVETISQLLQKSGDKVAALLAKEDFSKIIVRLGLTSVCYTLASEYRKHADKQSDHVLALLWKTVAGLSFTGTALIGAMTIETIYNA